MKLCSLVILFLFTLKVISVAQTDTSVLVKYDYSFSFKEGIYPNFESLRNNNPVPYESLIYPQFNNDNFHKQLDTAEYISYNGTYGNSVTLQKYDIWGYCRNGKPYILWADKFNLIPYVGKITHFITTIKVYHSGYRDPFYNPYGYNPNTRVYQSEELRQYIIDMDTGEIIDYNLNNVELILKRDPLVYDEFMKLRKRKRTKQMFYYIGLYNQNNPLYLQE